MTLPLPRCTNLTIWSPWRRTRGFAQEMSNLRFSSSASLTLLSDHCWHVCFKASPRSEHVAAEDSLEFFLKKQQEMLLASPLPPPLEPVEDWQRAAMRDTF